MGLVSLSTMSSVLAMIYRCEALRRRTLLERLRWNYPYIFLKEFFFFFFYANKSPFFKNYFKYYYIRKDEKQFIRKERCHSEFRKIAKMLSIRELVPKDVTSLTEEKNILVFFFIYNSNLFTHKNKRKCIKK